jgi:phospho-N-acetylmuramoyl-pentapeptide-transferase
MNDVTKIVTEHGDILRALTTAMVAFVIAMVLTPFWTNLLYKYKFWKQAKEETLYGTYATVFQKLHGEKHKRNIPTMAGVLFWGVIAIVTFLFNLTRSQTYLPLFALIAVGILGAIDDWFNIGESAGLKGFVRVTK